MLKINKVIMLLVVSALSTASFATAGCNLDIRNSLGVPLILKTVKGHGVGYINFPQGAIFPVTNPGTPGTPVNVYVEKAGKTGSVTMVFADSTNGNEVLTVNTSPNFSRSCSPDTLESTVPIKLKHLFIDRTEIEVLPKK